MTGLFREHVERRVGAAYYVRQGQRAYQAVADFERSALRPEAPALRGPGGGVRALRRGARLPQARLLPPGRFPGGASARAATADPMVASALEALVGGEPAGEAVESRADHDPGRRAGGGPPVARPRARRGRAARSCATAWPAVRSAPSRPRTRSARSPSPRPPRPSRPPRRARPPRPSARRRAARSTGCARPGVARRPPRRRRRPRPGSRSGRRGRPRSTAPAAAASGSRSPAPTASGRSWRRCSRTSAASLDFSAGAIAQEADRGAAPRRCRRRARCPGCRSRRAGRGRSLVAAAERRPTAGDPVPADLGRWIERLGVPDARARRRSTRGCPPRPPRTPAPSSAPRRCSRCPS